jgi:putative PEP-CTERM system integral membrane protein
MKILFSAFFWTSNLGLLAIAYMGILPFLGFVFIPDFFAGELPFDFFLPFVGLLGMPPASMWSGIALRPRKPQKTYFLDQETDASADVGLKKSNFSLVRFFYGVEAPLIWLCFLRLFWLRELTPATGFMFVTAIVCVISFTYELIKPDSSYAPKLAWLQMATHSLMLLIGLYVGIVCLFYTLPAIWVAGVAFPYMLVVFPIYIGLVALMTMPLGLAIAYIQAWRAKMRSFAANYGFKQARLTTATVVIGWIFLFSILQTQPQIEAFALLNRPASDANRQELVQKSDKIRAGLLNAYLWRYRYPSNTENSSLIQDIYRDILHTSDREASLLQDAYNFITAPFLYKGSEKDSEEAAYAYAKFFDAPILRAERRAIQTAMQATSDRDEAKAGLLTVNQKKVLLVKQEASVKERGDWADIEIHEVYTNRTFERQEVFYYFSLPESAVITGLWLGSTDNRADSFPFSVSPRGAAQKVYNNEVRKRVDPALLEQVGPRNYRLRVFPIEPRLLVTSRVQSSPQSMHLWMTYKVMQQSNGWALPQLSERRNIFWDNQTERIYNGKSMQAAIADDQWFPATLPAQQNFSPQAHQVVLSSGSNRKEIVATPFQSQDLKSLQGKKFAVIVDSSFSMKSHIKELSSSWQWLQAQVAKENDIDIYLSTSEGGTPRRVDNPNDFNLDRITFFGLLRPQEILQQFTQLSNGKNYDAAIAITDDGSYEVTDETKSTQSISAPLWMVHLGNFPVAYDDSTLAAIQKRNGGVAASIQEALARIAAIANQPTSIVSVTDGYVWSEAIAPQSQLSEADREFQPLAARQLVLSLSQRLDKNSLPQLDAIHAIAKQSKIVTPYSSMIVLVNEQQKQALKAAEQNRDRFNRTVEDNQLPQPATNQLPQPSNNSFVSGVPEPAEWLLMAIAIASLLGVAIAQRRRQLSTAND